MASVSKRMKDYFKTEFQGFQHMSWHNFLEKLELVYNAGYRNGLRKRGRPGRYPSSPKALTMPVEPSNGEYRPIKKECNPL